MKQSNINMLMSHKNAWDYFKVRRKKDKDFTHTNPGYLTMLQREAMLEDLFKIILG
jgi:hypothetical protein